MCVCVLCGTATQKTKIVKQIKNLNSVVMRICSRIQSRVKFFILDWRSWWSDDCLHDALRDALRARNVDDIHLLLERNAHVPCALDRLSALCGKVTMEDTVRWIVHHHHAVPLIDMNEILRKSIQANCIEQVKYLLDNNRSLFPRCIMGKSFRNCATFAGSQGRFHQFSFAPIGRARKCECNTCHS